MNKSYEQTIYKHTYKQTIENGAWGNIYYNV